MKKFRNLKKVLAVFIAAVFVMSMSLGILPVSAEDSKMIIFNRGTDSGTQVSNILLPLNLASGGKYKLTFKMRTPNSSVPIIGSMRTTGKGYAFSEPANVNNSETPDGNGLYCAYDPETLMFTAVIQIDRYGATTTGGANCFLTIGSVERDGSVDSSDYAAAFVFAEPELYKLDADGNKTGDNLCPAINTDTLALNKTYNFSHGNECTFNTAEAAKWAIDTNLLECNAQDIPESFFETNYTGSIDSIFSGEEPPVDPPVQLDDKMLVISSEGETTANILMALKLDHDGKYKLTFKLQKNGDALPVVGSIRTSKSATASYSEYDSANNSATPDGNGCYTSYDEETGIFTAVLTMYKYGGASASGMNCAITIGTAEHSGEHFDSTAYGTSFAIYDITLKALDSDGNETGENLAPAINDNTVNLTGVYHHTANPDSSSGNISQAPVNKYSVDGSSTAITCVDIEENYFKDHTPGDINKDGDIDNKDLTRLFQYLSNWEVEVNEDALDVNGDGSVNNKDLTRLFQYLSNWEVEIF